MVQLDSDKCQGLVETLGTKVMIQGDTWKPLIRSHSDSEIKNHVTMGVCHYKRFKSM
jgi:hypothetical protein